MEYHTGMTGNSWDLKQQMGHGQAMSSYMGWMGLVIPPPPEKMWSFVGRQLTPQMFSQCFTSLGNKLVWLVVYLPLWKILVSWDDDIPNIWKNKKCSKPPTSCRTIPKNHPCSANDSWISWLCRGFFSLCLCNCATDMPLWQTLTNCTCTIDDWNYFQFLQFSGFTSSVWEHVKRYFHNWSSWVEPGKSSIDPQRQAWGGCVLGWLLYQHWIPMMKTWD